MGEVRRGNESSAVFRHLSQEEHVINWNGAEFLFRSKDKNLNQLIESFFISTKSNFNISEGFFNFDPITKRFISDHIKDLLLK